MICCLNPECEKPINEDGSQQCQSCGTELVETLFNRFRVKEPMGQGGFGRTYLGEDLHTFGEDCVVKQLIYAAQGSQANQKIVELFMREAQQLQQLRKNTQIPDLLAYFEEQGYLYLVQELVPGEDLQKELLRAGSFNEEKIRELLMGILPVLDFIHERGVVHRDLKPPNIMRRRDTGEIILIDFGVSKQLSRKLTTVYGVTSVGTQGYAPYEQMNEEGAKPEPASDLYSLGATCFHLLTGIYPGDLWARQGYGWCDHWTEYLKEPISTELQMVLSKLLKFEVRDRYQSASEVLAALNSRVPATELFPPEPSVPLPPTEVVEQEEIEHAKRYRQEQERRAYENNLRQYEQEFSQSIEQAYPLRQTDLDRLKQLQQQLGLRDVDVERVEQPIRNRIIQHHQEQQRRQEQAAERARLEREEERRRQEEAERVKASVQSPPQPPTSGIPSGFWTRRKVLTAMGMSFGGSVLLAVVSNQDSSPDVSESSGGKVTSERPSGLERFSFETVLLDAQGQITERSQGTADYFKETGINLDMVWIPGGRFTMGSPSGELEREDDEGPQHEVNVPGFFLGRYAVTQAQWEAVMGSNPSGFKGANRPVEEVSWEDAQEFCQKLSSQTGLTYRLPSEAEWEYACRAGTTTPFYFGETLSPNVANYRGTSTYGSGPKGEYREQTTEVGIFQPNGFGLYDMHGNVLEWCQDRYHENYNSAPTDGSAWESGSNESRVLRGGSWDLDPRYCRSALRFRSDPGGRVDDYGFRLALSASRNS